MRKFLLRKDLRNILKANNKGKAFYSTYDYVDFWQLSMVIDVHYNPDWCVTPIISNYFGLTKEKFSQNCVYLAESCFWSLPNWESTFDMSFCIFCYFHCILLSVPPLTVFKFPSQLHVNSTPGKCDSPDFKKISICLSTNRWHVKLEF